MKWGDKEIDRDRADEVRGRGERGEEAGYQPHEVRKDRGK